MSNMVICLDCVGLASFYLFLSVFTMKDNSNFIGGYYLHFVVLISLRFVCDCLGRWGGTDL